MGGKGTEAPQFSEAVLCTFLPGLQEKRKENNEVLGGERQPSSLAPRLSWLQVGANPHEKALPFPRSLSSKAETEISAPILLFKPKINKNARDGK